MAFAPRTRRCPHCEVDNFVGRAGELAILDAEMQTAKAGRPRFVLVEGEAGIGKSSQVHPTLRSRLEDTR